MSTYGIARLRNVAMGPAIVEYLQRIDATLEPFGGKFVVHGGPYEVLEGNWSGDVIIIEFADRERARGWYELPAYREILPLRTEQFGCRRDLHRYGARRPPRDRRAGGLGSPRMPRTKTAAAGKLRLLVRCPAGKKSRCRSDPTPIRFADRPSPHGGGKGAAQFMALTLPRRRKSVSPEELSTPSLSVATKTSPFLSMVKPSTLSTT